MTASITEHFASLKDPRIERKKLHKLMDIIVLVISATVSGAEGWEAIEHFGHDKKLLVVRQAKLVASFRVKVPDGRASRMRTRKV